MGCILNLSRLEKYYQKNIFTVNFTVYLSKIQAKSRIYSSTPNTMFAHVYANWQIMDPSMCLSHVIYVMYAVVRNVFNKKQSSTDCIKHGAYIFTPHRIGLPCKLCIPPQNAQSCRLQSIIIFDLH